MGYNNKVHKMIYVEVSTEELKEVENFLYKALLEDSPDYRSAYLANLEYAQIAYEYETFPYNFIEFCKKNSIITRRNGEVGGLWTNNQNLNLFINLNRYLICIYKDTSEIFWFLRCAEVVKENYSFKHLSVFEIFDINENSKIQFNENFMKKYLYN
jgi:hypothetical protein